MLTSRLFCTVVSSGILAEVTRSV